MPFTTELSHQITTLKCELLALKALLKMNKLSLEYLQSLEGLTKRKEKLPASVRQEYVKKSHACLTQLNAASILSPSRHKETKLINGPVMAVPADLDTYVYEYLVYFKVGRKPELSRKMSHQLFSFIMEEMIQLPREMKELEKQLQQTTQAKEQEEIDLLQRAMEAANEAEMKEEREKKQKQLDALTVQIASVQLDTDRLIDVAGNVKTAFQTLAQLQEQHASVLSSLSSFSFMSASSESLNSEQASGASSPDSHGSLSSTLMSDAPDMSKSIDSILQAIKDTNASTLHPLSASSMTMWCRSSELTLMEKVGLMLPNPA